MLSFHNDIEVKNKYIDRIKNHMMMDNIIQGTGWQNGKGCAVGCTLESYDHSRYPVELGLPEWLARLEDSIFEGLSKEESKKWPILFLESINIGVNVENVKHKLAILRLERLIEIQKKLLESSEKKQIFVEVINSINLIKRCHELELNKSYCDWSAAWSSAWSSARSAAESAAWSEAWKEEANDLIKLLSECKD